MNNKILPLASPQGIASPQGMNWQEHFKRVSVLPAKGDADFGIGTIIPSTGLPIDEDAGGGGSTFGFELPDAIKKMTVTEKCVYGGAAAIALGVLVYSFTK